MVLTSLKSRKFASDCESYRLRAATGQRPDRISQSRQRQFAYRSVYQNRQIYDTSAERTVKDAHLRQRF